MNPVTGAALRIVRDEDERGALLLGRRIRHALVCLDRSHASEIGLLFGAIFAETFAAELTLAHVIPAAHAESGVWSRTDVLQWEIARREAQQYLERARAVVAASVPSDVRTVVSQGTPSDRLSATAREVGADLTIFAGQSALDGSALGNTAQRVLAGAPGSVMVAHASRATPPEHILVPLDGSARTESVLPSVIALARRYCAEVTLVHVVCDRPASAVLARPADVQLAQQLTERLKQNADDYLERVRSRELRDLPDVHCVVRSRSDERRALLAIATQLRADLIVIAAHGATGQADDPFGSVASYLLAHARVPLLVIQDVVAPMLAQDPLGLWRRPSGVRRREEA